MDLLGALSNSGLQRSWVDLADKLEALRAEPPAPRPARRTYKVRRQGQVRGIIESVLAARGEAMRAQDIHNAVQRELGEEVPWSSIGNCLRRNSYGLDARFERVGHGRYRLANR